MNLLIFFSLVFATIILAIVLQRIIHCPILVGLAFFSIFLVVAVILGGTTFVLAAIILGIIAFIAAFLDCIFRRSGFFRNNNCLSCDCEDDDDNNARTGRNSRRNNWNCNCNCQNDALRIVNANGDTIARINGNQISCFNNNNSNGCGNSNLLVTSLNDGNNINTISTNAVNTSFSCGCNNRNYWGR